MSAYRDGPAPVVFRIRDAELRRRLEAFTAAEAKRIGYRLTGTEVAERAIREFLDRRLAASAEALISRIRKRKEGRS